MHMKVEKGFAVGEALVSGRTSASFNVAILHGWYLSYGSAAIKLPDPNGKIKRHQTCNLKAGDFIAWTGFELVRHV